YRLDPPIAEPWRELACCTRIDVRELSPAGSAELVRALLRAEPPPELTALVDKAQGNPFFVEEVVRGLVESGALARDAGGWRLTRELDDAAVPDSIEGVITARLDRLEDRSREVLQVAAVVGRRFPYPVLSGVISRADGLLDRLRLLSEADLIQPEDVERDLAYLFRHALTRDVAYEAILYARRRDLHRRVARRIEELHPDRLDDQLALLARHYLLAEEWEPAFDYHLRAGRYAQARYANREAITLLRQALQIADFRLQNVESQSAIYNLQSAIIELHERLGVIYALIGEYDAALDRYLQALDLLRRQPGAPIDGLVRLHHHIARVYEKRADFDTAFDWVERALALAGDSPSADLTRCVLLGAGLHRRQGRYQQALEWSARALSLAEARGSRRDQAHAMMLLAGTYRNMGDNTRAMELLSRCLPLYEQVQDLLGLADAHNDLANTYYELGRLAEARAHYEAGAEIKQAIGDVYGQAMIANNLGDLLKLQGHVDEAIVQFERSLAIFERLGSLYASGVLHMNLGATYLLRGDDAVAERHLRRAAELYDQAGAEDFLPELERYLAELHLRRGDLPKARLACELALANAARLEARAEEGMARRTLAQVLLRDGDVAGAWDELERSLAILRAAASAHEAARTLLANEVARQIWFILDRAIKSYYPAVENVVLVGGDNVIPFFRVPDETLISNESDYYGQLSSQALGLPPPLPSDAGTPGKPATGLEGSLFYHTIQTDNYYGDRAFTPWRGRGLYLPDLAVGRLVETPEDIDSYLKAYDAYGANFSGYTVNADRAIPGRYGSAYVTGYDFLKDEATAIAGLYGQYGFDPNTTFDKAHALDSSLIGDTWTVDDLTRTWFANQLPQLAGTYGTGSGPQTRYYLMSLNGHFTHYEAIPADLNGGFTAERLYSPTVDAAYPYNAYFKDLYFGGTAPSDTASLVYSVGCHSGLSVINGDLSSDSTYGYKVDFPSAALKQGGNWIGNTGFGYGDSDLIAYSEKLAVQFTRAIGRKVVDANNNYLGPTIGESLARAKRDYVRTAGPGSFGPYDEKVIEEWTLYGLPFIRVKVPSPTPPPYPGGLFDPASVPVPDQTKASLGPNSPTFTRLITVSNIVYSMDTLGGDGVPRVKTAQVQDSFLPGTFTVTGEDLVAAGKPVLPLLTYDITLQDTGKTNGEGSGIPQPRGVRMVGGAMLPELTGFNPHVTTITTDTTFLRQLSDPDLTAQGQWLPEQPFTYQRTSAGGVYADKLLVTPAQFWAASARSGRLRRFSRMVFEVSYIDPRSARLSTLADTTPPRISDVTIVLPPQVKAAIAAAQIKISAKVSDGAGGPLTVKVTYSNDGTTWQTQSLTLNGATGLYEGFITPPPLGTNIFVIVDARDGAGNVATYIAKGALLSYAIVDVPIVRK
ncbi:MAG TPA: tetratricopeptide repeat protein, partial [Roseiflexaceae bacterium]